MAAHKWLKCLIGNAVGAPDGDMRVKRFEIRFETRRKERILNSPMEPEEMRVSLADTDPDHRWTVARIESSHTAQGQKKRWYPHLTQNLAQPFVRRHFHLS